MITFKLVSLPLIIKAFNVIINNSLPIRLSYQINKIMKHLQNECDLFNTTRSSLIQRYSQYDEDGNLQLTGDGELLVADSLKESYLNELKEFNEIECQIDCDKIRLSDLDNSGVNISPVDLSILENFIEFDL